ncbi:MAG: hypothetical protein V2A62_02085 [Candidatus Woesearchaeota archaeon]
MGNTTYRLDGEFRAWSGGHFIVSEEQTPQGPLQTFEVHSSLFPPYNPNPTVLERFCRSGTHVCYYGTYSTEMEDKKMEVECRIAPPINGYTGMKMLDDLLTHRRNILASNPNIKTIHLDYVKTSRLKETELN